MEQEEVSFRQQPLVSVVNLPLSRVQWVDCRLFSVVWSLLSVVWSLFSIVWTL